jgi:hypothetical protein
MYLTPVFSWKTGVLAVYPDQSPYGVGKNITLHRENDIHDQA